MKLNCSLMCVNKHQQCVISQLRQDTVKLTSQVVEARAATQQNCGDVMLEKQQLKEEMHRLKVYISTLEMEKASTRREMETCQDHWQNTLANLKTAQKLIEQHQEKTVTHQTDMQTLEEQVDRLKQEVDALRTRHRQATEQAERLNVQISDQNTLWAEKVSVAERDVSRLRGEVEDTESRLKSSQDLVSSLQIRLQDVSQQLADAQAVLNVERRDAEGQTDVSTFMTSSASVQTERNQSDVGHQTCPDVRVVVTQTWRAQQVEEASQTVTVPTTWASSQTVQPSFFSQSAQTPQVTISDGSTQTERQTDCGDFLNRVSNSGQHNSVEGIQSHHQQGPKRLPQPSTTTGRHIIDMQAGNNPSVPGTDTPHTAISAIGGEEDSLVKTVQPSSTDTLTATTPVRSSTSSNVILPSKPTGSYTPDLAQAWVKSTPGFGRVLLKSQKGLPSPRKVRAGKLSLRDYVVTTEMSEFQDKTKPGSERRDCYSESCHVISFTKSDYSTESVKVPAYGGTVCLTPGDCSHDFQSSLKSDTTAEVRSSKEIIETEPSLIRMSTESNPAQGNIVNLPAPGCSENTHNVHDLDKGGTSLAGNVTGMQCPSLSGVGNVLISPSSSDSEKDNVDNIGLMLSSEDGLVLTPDKQPALSIPPQTATQNQAHHQTLKSKHIGGAALTTSADNSAFHVTATSSQSSAPSVSSPSSLKALSSTYLQPAVNLLPLQTSVTSLKRSVLGNRDNQSTNEINATSPLVLKTTEKKSSPSPNDSEDLGDEATTSQSGENGGTLSPDVVFTFPSLPQVSSCCLVQTGSDRSGEKWKSSLPSLSTEKWRTSLSLSKAVRSMTTDGTHLTTSGQRTTMPFPAPPFVTSPDVTSAMTSSSTVSKSSSQLTTSLSLSSVTSSSSAVCKADRASKVRKASHLSISSPRKTSLLFSSYGKPTSALTSSSSVHNATDVLSIQSGGDTKGSPRRSTRLQPTVSSSSSDPADPKRCVALTRKGILKACGQDSDSEREKTVTFAPLEIGLRAMVQSVTTSDDDQSLFSDDDDEITGTQDSNTSTSIRRQCKRIVGLLDRENDDVTTPVTSRKRKRRQ